MKEKIKTIYKRWINTRDSIQSEESTKQSMILPFLSALGYDVFNPEEITPEKECEVNGKKGEKIDYAVSRDGEQLMIVECKHWNENLDKHEQQLRRYYTSSKAKIGVLTNGLEYRFYADFDQTNLMDKDAFFCFDLNSEDESELEFLLKFKKENFNLSTILSEAEKLKYSSSLRKEIYAELESPSADFIKLFAKKVYSGVLTQQKMISFKELIVESIRKYILSPTVEEKPTDVTEGSSESTEEKSVNDEKSRIVTTKDELIALGIVKAICSKIIDSSRCFFRDAISYSSVLLDDSNRKPIVRLYLNSINNMKIIIVSKDRNEQVYRISKIEEIMNYEKEILDNLKELLEV